MDSLLILLVFASVYTTAGDNLPAVGGKRRKIVYTYGIKMKTLAHRCVNYRIMRSMKSARFESIKIR